MEFKFYDPRRLIPLLKERGISSVGYRVCQGCVFTNVPPEDCFHSEDDFKTPSVQSDMFCPHCYDTIEDDRKRFHLHVDKTLNQRVRELEAILEMV